MKRTAFPTIPPQASRVEAQFQRALQLHQQGRHQEAAELYGAVIKAEPRHFDALHLFGVLELQKGDARLAMERIRKAIKINANQAIAHANLGSALASLGRCEEAVASYERALAINPQLIDVRANRATTLQTLRRYEDAATAFGEILRAQPAYMFAAGSLFHARRNVCDWSEHDSSAAMIVNAIELGQRADRPFSFLAVSDSPGAQLKCARLYASGKYPQSPRPVWQGERYAHDKIRVGYVSADFRNHAVSVLLAGVLERHDKQSFESVGISLAPAAKSALGDRIIAAFDRHVEASGCGAAEIAGQIRSLEIDILVDLMGFTQGCRPEIFAARCAPIQVNFLGYPGTSGAPYMDYILADEYVIPPDSRRHYAERVAYLPNSFQPGDDRRTAHPQAIPSRASLGLPERGFIFCSFNNSYKLNPEIFGVWMRLLQATPGSILWLLAESDATSKNLRAAAEIRGVDSTRLVFVERIAYADHLARLAVADLFLDSLPFNAGTTASDALWAGVPVISCSGSAMAARMAGSMLHTLGLADLVTDSLEAYEALALRLASAPRLLAEVRQRLEDGRVNSPLFDTELFCRHLEAAYLSMWERQQRALPPESFAVEAIGRVG
jgi:protein O-GlcNAc transferase